MLLRINAARSKHSFVVSFYDIAALKFAISFQETKLSFVSFLVFVTSFRTVLFILKQPGRLDSGSVYVE